MIIPARIITALIAGAAEAILATIGVGVGIGVGAYALAVLALSGVTWLVLSIFQLVLGGSKSAVSPLDHARSISLDLPLYLSVPVPSVPFRGPANGLHQPVMSRSLSLCRHLLCLLCPHPTDQRV